MVRPNTLQSTFSIAYLQRWAGDKIFQRGENYYHDNCVKLLQHSSTQAIGEVSGTQCYRVEWQLTGAKPNADCTCPAMNTYGVCKHAVALALLLLDEPPPKKSSTKLKNEVDEFSQKYPNIADWLQNGWLEMGRNGADTSLIRVYDEGGLVWEGGTRHKSLDKILQEADKAIAKWHGE